MERKFKIDIFELYFIAESCIPPRPIARAMFWDDLCDKYYHEMTSSERLKMFTFLKDKINLENEDCRYFFARYNPLNQYEVDCFFNGKADTHLAFRWNEKYQMNKTQSINENYIKEIRKIKTE
jgi:hypothetical protein